MAALLFWPVLDSIGSMMDVTIAKLRPRILRTEADPRPVVVMTCGIAGTHSSRNPRQTSDTPEDRRQ